jgi:hypothetical protein
MLRPPFGNGSARGRRQHQCVELSRRRRHPDGLLSDGAPLMPGTAPYDVLIREMLIALERARLDVAFLGQLLDESADQSVRFVVTRTRQRLDQAVERTASAMRAKPVYRENAQRGPWT